LAWKKIMMQMTDIGFIKKICCELSQVQTKYKLLSKKWLKTINRHFVEEQTQLPANI
jgi:hypothetical protein